MRSVLGIEERVCSLHLGERRDLLDEHGMEYRLGL